MSGSTVLVADSQPLFAEALSRLLDRDDEFQPLEPRPQSGVTAAQAAVILRPRIAILDLWLEGISAPEVARSVVAKSPTTRIVVMGWFHTPDHVQRSFAAGAAGFVSKATSSIRFLEAIRRIVAGDRIVADGQTDLDDVSVAPSTVAAEGHCQGDGALTPRELQVLRLLGAGLPTEDIATRLDIARDTARRHITSVLEKTGGHSQLEAVATARNRGALP